MPPVDSVRSWLATYKSLPKENLLDFADQILADGDLIKEIFYILNDPRHHDFDPVYHQLYDLCRSSNSKLRTFCVQYIPTFIYIYLKEHSRLKGLDYDIFAKLESFLLALYNSAFVQNVIKYFPTEGVPGERFYPLNYPSIYHDPQFYALNTLMEHSHLFLDPSGSLISGRPMISYDEGADLEPITSVNNENRLKLVTALLYIHNQSLAEIPKCALKLTCMVIVNLCLSSFGDHLASYSIPASYNSANFPLAGRNRFRDSIARFGNVTENRIPADEHLYREFLHTVYHAIYNGASEEGLEALEAIHMRSTYQLYPEVLLLVGAIKNSVNKATLKDAKSSTMGIWLSSVPPSAIAALSKSAITNASFKLRKLPEDISPIVTTTLQSVREEEVHTPSPSFTSPPIQNLGDKKQMSKAAIAANRLKEVLLHPTSNPTTSISTGNKGNQPHEMIPMATLLAADALEQHGSGSATITGGEVDRHVRYPHRDENETGTTQHNLGHLFDSHETTAAGQVQPSHHAFSFLPAGAAKFWTKALALGLENQARPGPGPANLEIGPTSDQPIIANLSHDITPPAYPEAVASAPSSNKDRIKHKLDKVRARLKEFQQHLEEPGPLEETNKTHKVESTPGIPEDTYNQGPDTKPDVKAKAGPPKKTKTLKKQMAQIAPAFAATLKKAQTDPSSQNGVGARRKSTGPGIEHVISRDFEEASADQEEFQHYPNLKPSLPPLSRQSSRKPADLDEEKTNDIPYAGTKSGTHHLVKFGKADVMGKRAKLQPHKKGLKDELAALKINLKKTHSHQSNSKSALDLSPPHSKPIHSALKNTQPDQMTFSEDLPTDQPTIKPIISDDEASSGAGEQGAPALEPGTDKIAGTESSSSQREPLPSVTDKDKDKERLKGTEKLKQFIDNAMGTVEKERKISDGRGGHQKALPDMHHLPSLDGGSGISTHYNKKRRKTGLPSKKKILAEILGGLHQGHSQSSSSSEDEKHHPKITNKKLNVKREKGGKSVLEAGKGGTLFGATITSSSPDLLNSEEGIAVKNLNYKSTEPDTTQAPDDEGSYISDRFNRLQQLQKCQEQAFKTEAKKGAGGGLKTKKYYVKKKKSLPIAMLNDDERVVLNDSAKAEGETERRLSDPVSVTDADSKEQGGGAMDSEKMQQLAGKIKKFLTVSSTSSSPGPPHRKDKTVRSDTSDNTTHPESTSKYDGDKCTIFCPLCNTWLPKCLMNLDLKTLLKNTNS